MKKKLIYILTAVIVINAFLLTFYIFRIKPLNLRRIDRNPTLELMLLKMIIQFW